MIVIDFIVKYGFLNLVLKEMKWNRKLKIMGVKIGSF